MNDCPRQNPAYRLAFYLSLYYSKDHFISECVQSQVEDSLILRKIMSKNSTIYLILSILLFPVSVTAGDVQIVSAEFNKNSNGTWNAHVTLKHSDTGWKHYADNWRIVDSTAHILGDRVLYHPHVNEQPFTRSLSHVEFPKGTRTVYIEAHDKLHGWTKNRLKIDLNKAGKGSLKVEIKTSNL